MRYIIMSVFLIAQTLCCMAVDVNVKSYGAKGDGIQDDAPYLNLAIEKALLLGANLFIPSGTYKCETFKSSSKIIRMDQYGIKTIKIYGEDGTKLTTAADSGSLFYVFNKNADVIIENIFFENTHAVTLKQTNAIQLLGTDENSIENFTIKNCRFEGFSTAIIAQGVKGFVIQNNVFASPKGHDNAQNSSAPAVYIWLFDNANGQCYDVKILNNSASGYTGNNILETTTQRPMDGFVYGTAYNVQIDNNTTWDFSEEHIALAPQTTYTTGVFPVSITKNKFHQSIPLGSMKNGLPLISNYGVRADCNDVTISNNDFYDYTSGVLVLTYDYPTLKQHNFTVSGNRFYSPTSIVYHVREAIKIQGSITNSTSNCIISGNTVSIDGIQLKSMRSVITVFNCINVRIEQNKIRGRNILLNGYSMTGILVKDCAEMLDTNNEIIFEIVDAALPLK